MTDDWLQEDPFANPEDPAAREREQRRLEREERRKRREDKQGGKQAPAPAPPPPEETPPPPRTAEQEFWDEPAEAPAGDPAPGDAEAVDPAQAGAGEVEASQPAVAAEPVPVEEPADDLPPDEGLPPERTPDPRGSDHGRGGSGSGGGVLAGARRHPLLIVAVAVALVGIWFLWSLFQPFHGDGSGRVAITVPKGASVSEVGDLLSDRGVIDSSTFFQIRATLEGKRSELYAGAFTLAEGMSYGAALDALSEPPLKRVVSVTIPEGYSRAQAAQLVEEDGLEGDYTKETVRSRFLDPAQYGGEGAKNLEGFLFPDTFELKPGAPAADLVQLQLQDFKRQIKSVDMGYAKSKNLTVFDVLIIASLIEDEAGIPSQRKLVAAVVYNRLHEGMPLGIDATIRFATGNYEQPLTESELAVDSPYNTRTNAGLPPGPINSPGLEAIEAAAHPAKADVLFYVNKPNTCGELAFSKNEAEFESDVAAYNEAREANGGNEPSSCGE
jgi:UPF0755 protein